MNKDVCIWDAATAGVVHNARDCAGRSRLESGTQARQDWPKENGEEELLQNNTPDFLKMGTNRVEASLDERASDIRPI
jgi:hypothetical protein